MILINWTYFLDGATIKCLEAKRQKYNIEIYAVPCDGIEECQNGEDESHCSGNWYATIIAILFAYVIVTFAWCFTYFMVYANLKTDIKGPQELAVEKYFDNQSCAMVLKKKLYDEFGTTNFSELKGDALAKLKVISM